MGIEIKIIYPDIYEKHVKMIKNIQKSFLGKSDMFSKTMVEMCTNQLIKITQVSIPERLIKKLC